MNREFQAVYRHTEPTSVGSRAIGDALSVNVVAESADRAHMALTDAGLAVISIAEIRALVDWSKPVLTRDEFGALLNLKPGTVSSLKTIGKIPWSSFGNGGCPTALAKAFVERHLNSLGKKLLAEIKLQSA